MRILLANKFYFLKGGAERYCFELSKLLEKHGEAVVPFAMEDSRNLETPYAKYFPSRVLTEKAGVVDSFRTVGRMLWSFEAARKMRALVREEKPDILHAHNIYHQLSPSILRAAAEAGVPSVMTLHDHHLISPNYNMYLDGRVAEPSVAHPYLDTFVRRLVDRSLAKSAVSAFEGWLHRTLRAYADVQTFIAPSRYLKDMVVKHGVEEARVQVVPHFIDLAGRTAAESSKPSVLFVGRLSEEKGAHVLVEAMTHLPNVEAVIVGEGPARTRLHGMARGAQNVRFAGELHGEDLEREYAAARVIVIPSVCPETFGLTALEAYAWGKPVIASDIGGLPEVVRAGETGLLSPPGNVELLVEAINRLVQSESEAKKMGLAGRRLAESEYNPEIHYRRLKEVYERASRAA